MSCSNIRFTIIRFIIVICFVVLGSCFNIESVIQPDVLMESPVWSPQESALYWVNALGQTVFRMDAATGEITTKYIYGGPTLAVALVKDHPGYVIVAMRANIYLLKWGAPGGDEALKLLTMVDHKKPDNSISYLRADYGGRLWIGTLGKYDPNLKTIVPLHEGTLYSLEARDLKHPAVKKRHVTLSKGTVWSLDNKRMYYNDGTTRRITAFDYDLKNGNIYNETVIFSFDEHDIPGFPDGMTLDADQNLWVATYGSLILNIDSQTGRILRAIELPVDQTTSLTWGGPLMNTLYVTTGGLNVVHPKPMSGTVLKITHLGTIGCPDHQFYLPDLPNY